MSEYVYSDADEACSTGYILPVLLPLIEKLPPGSVVADLGCGNGSLLAQLRGYKWELHGIESSMSGLAHASKAYPEIHFSHGDLATDMSADPLRGKCDLVISTEVIEHIFLPRIFARNCWELLRPGGTLILSTPYHGYGKNVLLAVTGKLDRHFTALWDYGHIKFWSRRTLTALLRETGFEDVRFVGAGRIPFLWKSMVMIGRKSSPSQGVA